MLNDILTKELNDLDAQGLKRELRLCDGIQDRLIHINQKKVLNYCSNNYLGLAGDRRLVEAADECMKQEGFGSGASRLVCGNLKAHRSLEQTLASFKGTEDCIIFSTGYMANVGLIASLFDRHDCIFSDRLNHASIVDGIRLSGAQMKRYPHKDMAALEEMIKDANGFRRRCIVTDSVFSMDGDIAPLDEIVALAKKYDCVTMIDEAHAFGVMGEKGKGCAEHFNVAKDIDIQMGTLSKAAGSFGAYVCGSNKLISFFVNKARSFIYTTGMPPAVAAASQKAVTIIRDDPSLRKKLWDNTDCMRSSLKEIGFNTMDSATPIIPILAGEAQKAVEFSKRLWERGLFVSAIRPPTVPVNTARLRLTVMATHTQEDLQSALNILEQEGKSLCLI